MLRSAKGFIGYNLRPVNGKLGKSVDLYFDDVSWTVRYLVADTSRWLRGRKVLISTESLGEPQWNQKEFPVNLTQEKVRNSPDIDTQKPIGRKHEETLNRYYGRPRYWEEA